MVFVECIFDGFFFTERADELLAYFWLSTPDSIDLTTWPLMLMTIVKLHGQVPPSRRFTPSSRIRLPRASLPQFDAAVHWPRMFWPLLRRSEGIAEGMVSGCDEDTVQLLRVNLGGGGETRERAHPSPHHLTPPSRGSEKSFRLALAPVGGVLSPLKCTGRPKGARSCSALSTL